MPDLYQILCRC